MRLPTTPQFESGDGVSSWASRRLGDPAFLWLLATVALAVAGASLAAWYDHTVAVVLPAAAAVAIVMLRYPVWAYAFTLAQLSVLPIGGHFLGFFVPQSTQFLLPGLFLAVIARRILARDWGIFRLGPTDWFVIGFLIVGYAGIFLMPGPRQLKYFTNQEAFPALMYFVARALEIDRRQFQTILKAMLGATLFAVAAMTFSAVTHHHPIWGEARNPIGDISDAAAYFSLWPPLFLYAGALAMKQGRKSIAYLWFAGVLLSVLATTTTHERSGIVAAVLGLLVCVAGPNLRRYLLRGAPIAAVAFAAWMTTSTWGTLHARLNQKDPMLRRDLYRMKAIRYIESPKWNLWLGTGFARLQQLSDNSIPSTMYVYDPSWQQWRLARTMAQRPIHCAPLTVYGEYGIFGTLVLLLFVLAVFGRALRLYLVGEPPHRGPPDRDLIVAALGAAAAVALNAYFHNTDTVEPVLILLWSFSGVLMWHPDVFVRPRKGGKGQVDDGQQPYGAQADSGPQHGPASPTPQPRPGTRPPAE